MQTRLYTEKSVELECKSNLEGEKSFSSRLEFHTHTLSKHESTWATWVCVGLVNRFDPALLAILLLGSWRIYVTWNENQKTRRLIGENPMSCPSVLSRNYQLRVSVCCVCVRFVTLYKSLYTVSQKNVPPLPCHNFDAHELILTFFGRNVTDKVGNQKTLYYATSNNLCFCTTWQNAETRKSHISLNWIVLHTCTMHVCVIFLKEKNCHLWYVW